MEKKIGVKIIKPPIKEVTSGKIFKPTKVFLNKMWVKNIAVAFTFWAIVVLGFLSITYIVALTDPSEIPDYTLFLKVWFWPVNFWTLIINLIWLIPSLIVTPFYFNSIEYSVKAESGETMPEIYVKKGFVTVTRKHVPFRTITNISSRAGPFDRFFNIGNVNIETAGFSGTNQSGPEEKLEGIVFYEEVRDFILNELRKFRSPYVTGTELVSPVEEPVPRIEGLNNEILLTLKEIRDVLKTKYKPN